MSDPVFLRAQNIEEGYLNFLDAKRLTKEAFYAEDKAILLDGDIVLTIDGALLGIAAVHRVGYEPCCISNHMVRLHHGVKIEPDFLSWVLNSPLGQKQIKRGITGSAIPGIRTDAIKRILVPLPPKKIQLRMVQELEDARQARKAKLTLADELLNGLDAYLSEQAGIITPSEEKKRVFAVRLSQLQDSLNPERYMSINLEKTIKGTTITHIAQIFDKKVTPSVEAPNEEWDWIRIDDLPNYPLNVGEVRTALGSEIEGSFFEAQENNILLARLGPTIQNAKFVLCPKLKRRTVASSEFLILRCYEGWIPLVVLWILRTKLFRELIYSKGRGGTPSRYRVNRDDFADLPFPLIGPSKQKKLLAEILKRIEEVRLLRQTAISDWTAAKIRFEQKLLGEEA
jgi:hypothetical protein